MPKWVQSFWEDGDVTFLWEVGDDGWVTRSVELVGPEQCPSTAASLDEVLHARDTGGIMAVQRYERRYGVLVDHPIEDWTFPHHEITAVEFERFWSRSRSALEAGR